MKVAADRAPRFSDDFSTIYFGIKEAKKALPAGQVAGRGSSVIQAGAPGMGGTVNQPRVNEATEENPSLILWHAKDPRLQSQQIVQEAQDRAFNYLSEYRIVDNKFVRLSDDALRIGERDRSRSLPPTASTRASTISRRATAAGAMRISIASIWRRASGSCCSRSASRRRQRCRSRTASAFSTGATTRSGGCSTSRPARSSDITKGVPTMFADTSDDHNNLVPPPTAAARLDEGRQRRAALRRLRRVEGAGERRHGDEPHRRRQEERSSLPAPLFVRVERTGGGGRWARRSRWSRRRDSRTASISRSRCTSAPTASGRRRKVSPRSIRASRARRRSCGTTRSMRSRRRRTPTSTSTRSRRRSTSRTTTSRTPTGRMRAR